MDKLSFLENILGEYKKYPNGEVIFYCPKCKHRKKKLSVNLIKNVFHCWVCNFKGTLYNLVYELRRDKVDAFLKIFNNYKLSLDDGFIDKPKNGTISLPDGCFSLENSSTPYTIEVKNYLRSRGISEKVIKKYNIIYWKRTSEDRRILIPYYDNNKLVYYISRKIYDHVESPKYLCLNVPRSNMLMFINKTNVSLPIILVEGVFDAIKVDFNCVPLLSNKISDSVINQLLVYPSIYLALDNDKPGILGCIEIAKKLLLKGKTVYFVDISPYKDPGEMSRNEFFSRINNAEQINELWCIRKKLDII